MDNGSGWPFLLLFVAFSGVMLWAMLSLRKEAEETRRETEPGVYDWRQEGDYE